MSTLAQLRHAYHQLSLGVVKDQKQFADGLIAPAIREMEQEPNLILAFRKSERELMMQRDERDAVLRQALEALENVKPMVDAYWGGTSHDEAIAAIKGVFND